MQCLPVTELVIPSKKNSAKRIQVKTMKNSQFEGNILRFLQLKPKKTNFYIILLCVHSKNRIFIIIFVL